MAKQTKEQPKAKWYKVTAPSFIDNRFYYPGEFVQYAGDAGDNLEEAKDSEVKAFLKASPEDEDASLYERERELDDREELIKKREMDVENRQKELDSRAEAQDLREKELNDREAALKEKETPA